MFAYRKVMLSRDSIVKRLYATGLAIGSEKNRNEVAQNCNGRFLKMESDILYEFKWKYENQFTININDEILIIDVQI